LTEPAERQRDHPWFARCYDRLNRAGEKRWLGPLRDSMVGGLTGTVLEIGAGTGGNLPHYREAVRVVAAEPDRAMRRYLRRELPRAGVPVEVATARAEDLPYPDASFDAVVSTFVLCSVDDPGQALAEARRVLRPGGVLVFCEHVRGAGLRGRIQDAVTPVWVRVAAGCRPNRQTQTTIEHSGLAIRDIETFYPRPDIPVVVPLIRGVAVRR
jgi:ubiquinone/menaquinone biosynthesis C-methylase UbiE